MLQVSVRGIDLAKQLLHAVGMDDAGTVIWRTRWTRNGVMPLIAKLPPVVIGMEACGGVHNWARCFRAHGHTVKLMASQFVKPSVKSNPHDRADAETMGVSRSKRTGHNDPSGDDRHWGGQRRSSSTHTDDENDGFFHVCNRISPLYQMFFRRGCGVLCTHPPG
jgi:hypothetical protein